MVVRIISMATCIAMALLSSNIPSMAGSTEDLSQYRWLNRLLVIIDSKSSPLFAQAQEFKTAHACDFKDRKLLVVQFTIGMDSWNDLPDILKQKNGLYLFGLDGGVKDYSPNQELLERLNRQIDSMPMRSRELSQSNGKSECTD